MAFEDQPPSYFICYARTDRRFAEQVQAELGPRRKRRQLHVWWDDLLETGDRHRDKIEERIMIACGAILLVSNQFLLSSYIQEHEWPVIRRREERDPSFRLFPVAMTELPPNELVETWNFLNDPVRAPVRQLDDHARDQVLTELGAQVEQHARKVSVARQMVEQGLPLPERPRLPVARLIGSPRPGVDGRPAVGRFFGVPQLPDLFVEPSEVQTVAAGLISDSGPGTVALCGDGGAGKTVLAAAVARRLAEQFPGGVHWVTIGEDASEETVRRHQEQLLKSLGGSRVSPPRDFNEGTARLRTVLADSSALVVIDDLWHPWQGRAFDVIGPGTRSRALMTSRFRASLPVGVAVTGIGRLGPDDALAFLQDATPSLARDRQALSDAAGVAGGLRLSLSVIAAIAVGAGSWAPVSSQLASLHDRFGSGTDTSSLHKAFHLAMQTLSIEDQRRAMQLAAFPADTRIPERLLARIWECDRRTARRVVERLLALRLALRAGDTTGGGGRLDAGLELHDEVVDFFILAAPTSPTATHLHLWQLAHQVAGSSWSTLAESEPYLFDRLIWHGARAAIHSNSLLATVANTDWLSCRTARHGPSAAEEDLGLVAQVAGLDVMSPVGRMQRVLRHGDLFHDLNPERDLRPSLSCWLEACGLSPAVAGTAPRLVGGSLPVPSPGLLSTIHAHSNSVWQVAFAPGGRLLASSSVDGSARLWNAGSGELVRELVRGEQQLQGLAFSPDGSLLATGDGDGTVVLSDIANGDVVACWTGFSPVRCLSFSPDGWTLAIAGADGRAWLKDTVSDVGPIELRGHLGGVWAVVFSPDGRRVATTSEDGTARIWNGRARTLRRLKGHNGPLRGVAFSPEGHCLATASDDRTARLWDVRSGQLTVEFAGHGGPVHGVAFSPDGRVLATTSFDGTARLWDRASGEHLIELTGHTSATWGVAFSPDGSRLATTGIDGTVRLWDTTEGTPANERTSHAGPVHAAAIAPNGRTVATASADGTARLWDVESGAPRKKLEGHNGRLWGVAFSPDGRRVATASDDQTARVWDARTGKGLQTLAGHTDVVWGVAFSPTGTWLATTSFDHSARLWDLRSHTTQATLIGHSAPVWGVAFWPDGHRVATASYDKTARCWEVPSGRPLAEFHGHRAPVRAVAVSPNGELLATGSDDGTARLWCTSTGDPLRELTGHQSAVWGITFSPDGRTVATTGFDGTLRFWDVATGTPSLVLAIGAARANVWVASAIAIVSGRHWALLAVDPAEPSLPARQASRRRPAR